MTEEIVNKIDTLVGQSYDADTFHCWTLVEELVPCAPKLNVIGGSYPNAIREFQKNVPTYLDDYEFVTGKLQDLDVILAGTRDKLNHAGVLLIDSGNELIIHNDKKGVHIEPFDYFVKQYQSVKAFRCK